MVLIELAHEIGINPKKVAGTQGGEYHSACPTCGGKDRFILQPNKKQKNCVGYYFCRQCNSKGDSIQFCKDFLGYSYPKSVDRVGAKNRNFIPILRQKKRVFTPTKIIPPSQIWMQNASTFVEWTHTQIMNHSETLKYLNHRGIPIDAVKRYKIGYCNKDLFFEKNWWGFNDSDNKRIWLPAGIVIPSIEPNGNVVRMKIRRKNYHENDCIAKYIAISGSMNGLNIIGNVKLEHVIVVESELDAYALHDAIGDLAFIIATGSNMRNPDEVSDYFVQKKRLLIIHDNDDAGLKMLNKWQRYYAHAQGYSVKQGKDIGEYIEIGGNIREFFFEIIKESPTKE